MEEDQEGEDSDVYDDEDVSRRRRVMQKYQTVSPVDADLIDKATLKNQIKKKMGKKATGHTDPLLQTFSK